MTTQQLIQLITVFFSAPVSMAMLFAVMIQPRRTYFNWVFAAFAGSVGFWTIGVWINLVEDPKIFNAEEELVWLAMGIGLTTTTFVWMVYVLTTPPAWLRNAAYGLLAATNIVGQFIVWSGDLLVTDENGQFMDITTAAYGILVAIVGAYLSALTLLWLDKRDESRFLRIPGILLTVGIGSNAVFYDFPVDNLMATVAVVYIGWYVLREQLFNPMTTLNRDLTTANEALSVANTIISEEKAKIGLLNEDLRRTSRYKSEFMANMSHELRTPLNAIMGYSSLLETGVYGEVNEKQIERLQKIGKNGRHLLELINDVLDLSKIEAGQMNFRQEALHLPTLLPELENTIEPLIAGKPVAFQTEIDADLPKIYADPLRMQQVFINFLSNAAKFTDEGHITLKMTCVTTQNGSAKKINLPESAALPDGQWVVACVEDTGIGIAADSLSVIFDEFRQVDGSATRQYGGTGLGLAISKRFIEMQDGVIWCESTPGEGSCFYCAMPAHAESPSA